MEPSPLLRDALAIAETFSRKTLLPRLAELEQQGGAPVAAGGRPGDGVPLVTLFRDLADRLGLASLAADAAQDPAANEGLLADHALGAGLMGPITRVCPGFALSFGASLGLCGQSLLRKGTPEQRAQFARPVLSFERIGCWALTEPESGSDAFSLRTQALKVPGGWELRGEKCFITNAPIADTFVVFARVSGTGGALDGQIRHFVVLREDGGVTTPKPISKMGMRASPTGSIFLEGVRLPEDRLIGDPEDSGKRAALETLLGERAALAAMAAAVVEESLALAMAYAKERKQFGQPIASYQAVQLRLARMYAAQETVRALIDRAEKLSSQGDLSLAYLCAAKYTASTLASGAAMEAVQIFGGAGYTTECRVEGLARDAKLLEIGGGTSDIQLLAVAREILR
jgi:alkylation response protein AidB-like acyl-CoA dehydrogenase